MARCYAIFALLALVLAISCRPKGPDAPVRPEDDASFLTPEVVERPGMDEDVASSPDRLHAGDVLRVRIFGATEMEEPKAVVDRSGFLHLPLVGDVEVADLTLSEAESAIVAQLRRFDRVSEVSLQLLEGTSRRVTVTGAVEKPGNIVIRGDETLAQVLAEAGGPRMTNTGDKLVQLGDLAGAQLVRGGTVLPVDFRLALQGHGRHNVRVRPGDVVVVPPAVSGRIVVLGNVNKPRTLPFEEGLRLTSALAEAGGLSDSADSQDVRILRGGYERPKLFVANARRLFQGKQHDPLLAPGDIVYVSKHWSATVGEVIEKVVPAVATAAVITALTKN